MKLMPSRMSREAVMMHAGTLGLPKLQMLALDIQVDVALKQVIA